MAAAPPRLRENETEKPMTDHADRPSAAEKAAVASIGSPLGESRRAAAFNAPLLGGRRP